MKSKLWQVVLYPAILLSQTAAVETGQAVSETDWLTIQSSPFYVFYLKSDQNYAEELVTLFQVAYADLSGEIDIELARPVSVFLAPSQKVFDELTGNSIPHWGEGVADPMRNLIILKSPSMTNHHTRLLKLVRHELTHILIGQAAGRPELLPKWFNEGMAIYLSSDEEFTAGQAISKALLSDSIIPLDDIDEVLEFQQVKATLAYEESYSFTLYLSDKYGFYDIIQLIHNLDASNSFKQAFQTTFGVELFDAEIDWYVYLEKKYRWQFLLDFEIYLWIFILLLFVLVFTAIKLRNRRTLLRWEQEERL